jgi:ATP-binding cassette subfamily B protein
LIANYFSHADRHRRPARDLASAARYYFVITLGERVVSDIRRDVFSHVTRLSPRVLRRRAVGRDRLAADRRYDADQIGGRRDRIGRIAQPHPGSRRSHHDGRDQPEAFRPRDLAAIPIVVLPLVAFGRSVRRKSRQAQDTLADATAYASEQIRRGPHAAGLHQREFRHGTLRNAVETAFSRRGRLFSRAQFLTFFAIFTIFTSVVAVLWFGSRDVLSGTMTPGTLGQFLLYSVFAAGALGALSEVWGELSQASGAAERMTEILAEVPRCSACQPRSRCPRPQRAR